MISIAALVLGWALATLVVLYVIRRTRGEIRGVYLQARIDEGLLPSIFEALSPDIHPSIDRDLLIAQLVAQQALEATGMDIPVEVGEVEIDAWDGEDRLKPLRAVPDPD